MVSALLVDDQALVRKGLHRLLSQEPGITVVGECDDGDQVIATVAHCQPDIVLMDVRMKRIDGIRATQMLQDTTHPPPVMMLTTFGEDDVLWSALNAGAAGFVLKDASTDDLIRATRIVAGGGAWLDPAITDTVIEQCRRYRTSKHIAAPEWQTLTNREREVLQLIAEGFNNGEICDRLCISEATVKTHISHIFDKLGARDRAAAIVYAYDHGIVLPQR